MRLPRSHEVLISRRKLVDYLLDTDHPVGATKARYLESRGYTRRHPELLEWALRTIAREGEVRSTGDTPWGRKYYVQGEVLAPDGRRLGLGTVWIVAGEDPPALVTAYPVKE